MKKLFLLAFITLLLSSFQFSKRIEKVSMASTIKTLKDGKVITLQSYTYYQSLGGQMTVHFTYPLEELVFTNIRGEYKQYNPASNSVYVAEGLEYSTRTNYLHQFLSFKTRDMGLSEMNYKQASNKLEDGMLVSEWRNNNLEGMVLKVKLVHEKNLPIFIANYENDELVSKTFYSKYESFEGITLPMRITEVTYLPEGDSLITKRDFSDVKFNEFVNDTYLKYQIPNTAKLLENPGPNAK